MRNRKPLELINVIDVEATCWNKNQPQGQQGEIIEIGIAVLEVSFGEIKESEGIFIKPQHSQVSDFCTKLTTITPEMVADAPPFPDACDRLTSDFSSRSRIWASYGDYDRNQFDRNCRMYDVKYPFGGRHINVKTLFALKHKLTKEVGMAKALDILGIELIGTHHRGVDDANNIATILALTLSLY